LNTHSNLSKDDDGPSFYTPNLLDYLDQTSLKATFFAVGSRCVQFPHTLQLEYMKGHQIGVHTWSHPPLTTLTNDEIIAELGWTKQIIKDVLGVTPNMMRPPFGDIEYVSFYTLQGPLEALVSPIWRITNLLPYQ